MMQAEPKGSRFLRRDFNSSVPHPSRLQMRTSDVPSDRDAHDASVPAERRERKGGTSRHQGKSGCWPLTVFKLGGSLAYAPELRGWLKAIGGLRGDRKSTRLNSSHHSIS